MIKLKMVSAAVLSLSLLLSGCGSSTKESQSSDGKKTASSEVKITLLNSKGEIQAQLEEAAKEFSKENPGTTLEVIPAAAGQSPFEKVTSMYASGNAPTIAMLDPGDVKKFADKALDLSKEKWVNDAVERSLDVVKTEGGKVLGFPFAVEGYGLIYNKAVLDKAVGGNFDPSSIKTRSDLAELMKKIQKTGVASNLQSPMDWSLAGHFLPIGYSVQSNKSEEVEAFLTNLKEGKEDLTKNEKLNGLLDTFDLLKENNINKKDPMSGTYEQGPELLGKGKVGIWFMGNWAWPQIKGFDTTNGNYGFLPVPISDNPDDYGNSQIPVGVTKYLIVDKEQNSPEQQALAKKFLEWLVYNEKGQDVLVNKANIIPAFKNITLEPQDPLAKSIKAYMNNNKTLQFMVTLPPDHWSQVGAFMQQYLDNKIDRKQLLKQIEGYWKSQQ
ncbi:ABC transporter substrate-binding protein [Neobacillus fumarioli]|uniref:ABC transporter substrate-binding protein n=1 Tax=Neobacillus fumarioli TaxID=105229 RepID=UPI000A7242D8|nr:ABC transporter substrate-binding protein [Neobacillus fumarioli]